MSKQDAGDDTPAPQPFERKSNYQVRPFTKADYECMDRVNDIFIRNVAIGAFCGCTPGAAFGESALLKAHTSIFFRVLSTCDFVTPNADRALQPSTSDPSF